MDSAVATDCELMLDSSSLSYEINAKRARFPCSLVWTPLPVLSWFIPFIGHIGICREDGVILDFAGPNFVCVDNFAFGAAARYIQIRKEQCLLFNESDKEVTWDDAIRKSTQEFQHKDYNIFTCNCHSFVANNLNRLCYGGYNRWNVVNLAALIFLKGRWVNKSAIIRSYLPFVIVFSLGILLGGWTFLTGLAAFTFVLLSWFILGSYCLKNLIKL